MGRRQSASHRAPVGPTLRPTHSDPSALAPSMRRATLQPDPLAAASGMHPPRRHTMEQDSHAAPGVDVQQCSTELALRPGSLALVPSNAAGDLALLEEEVVPRAEHELRQKVGLLVCRLHAWSQPREPDTTKRCANPQLTPHECGQHLVVQSQSECLGCWLDLIPAGSHAMCVTRHDCPSKPCQ